MSNVLSSSQGSLDAFRTSQKQQHASPDAHLNARALSEVARQAAGGKACKRYADTAAHAAETGLEIFCVTVPAAARIATLTPVTGFTSSGLTGVDLEAGTQLFGRWSTITLTSGAVVVNECDAQA